MFYVNKINHKICFSSLLKKRANRFENSLIFTIIKTVDTIEKNQPLEKYSLNTRLFKQIGLFYEIFNRRNQS